MKMLDVNIAGKIGSFAVSARFQAEQGVTALFGPSGAGKSTILKMIAGTARPDSGHIVAGERVFFDSVTGVSLPARARGVGFVFQDGRLFPHMSVRRNLTYARWAGRREASRSLEEVVGLLGLAAHLDRYPGTLSGGERQRVAIGRALLAEPEILLLDEPLSSLDRDRRAEILPYLEAVANEAHTPILYVSHETDEVARLADQVVVVENGNVGAIGTPAEILGQRRFPMDEEGPVSILEGRVIDVDERYGMARVEIGGALIELSKDSLPVEGGVRLRIHASDIAIAMQAHKGLSIRNQLQCTVEAVELRGHSAQIALSFGRQKLFSRITTKSADILGLKTGMQVTALIKAISVESGRAKIQGKTERQASLKVFPV
ncbi:molybdenum ABC transporter ATP-binding protein [Chelativorans sp. YIM 93263]|uniref:molybdenum ABC transporter ATP-binding protein n=1 Tax=Chelativorans sp. YIM 93263 TaxID=2906648 RepID=UPI002378EF9A|nr:molybdenum ABC transporter ATP-binding protein [Chelativorans sp. YIM 93263]